MMAEVKAVCSIKTLQAEADWALLEADLKKAIQARIDACKDVKKEADEYREQKEREIK